MRLLALIPSRREEPAFLPGVSQSATAIAIYIALCAVITIVATVLMTDYTGKDISGEYQTR
jgi:hypothetical protein